MVRVTRVQDPPGHVTPALRSSGRAVDRGRVHPVCGILARRSACCARREASVAEAEEVRMGMALTGRTDWKTRRRDETNRTRTRTPCRIPANGHTVTRFKLPAALPYQRTTPNQFATTTTITTLLFVFTTQHRCISPSLSLFTPCIYIPHPVLYFSSCAFVSLIPSIYIHLIPCPCISISHPSIYHPKNLYIPSLAFIFPIPHIRVCNLYPAPNLKIKSRISSRSHSPSAHA